MPFLAIPLSPKTLPTPNKPVTFPPQKDEIQNVSESGGKTNELRVLPPNPRYAVCAAPVQKAHQTRKKIERGDGKEETRKIPYSIHVFLRGSGVEAQTTNKKLPSKKYIEALPKKKKKSTRNVKCGKGETLENQKNAETLEETKTQEKTPKNEASLLWETPKKQRPPKSLVRSLPFCM